MTTAAHTIEQLELEQAYAMQAITSDYLQAMQAISPKYAGGIQRADVEALLALNSQMFMQAFDALRSDDCATCGNHDADVREQLTAMSNAANTLSGYVLHLLTVLPCTD